MTLRHHSRCSIGVEEDVAVLQVLGIGTSLEMLLKGVAALDGRDGSTVDGVVGHDRGDEAQ